jgi:hypothetical protein
MFRDVATAMLPISVLLRRRDVLARDEDGRELSSVQCWRQALPLDLASHLVCTSLARAAGLTNGSAAGEVQFEEAER